MDMNYSTLIALVALIVTLVTSITTALSNYANRANKEYGAKRDFDHLKNNVKQLAENILILNTEIDKNFVTFGRDIFEIKAYLGITKIGDRVRDDD